MENFLHYTRTRYALRLVRTFFFSSKTQYAGRKILDSDVIKGMNYHYFMVIYFSPIKLSLRGKVSSILWGLITVSFISSLDSAHDS